MTGVNFSDLIKAAGEAGFTVLPAGVYDVVVDQASHKPTSNGKPSISVQLKVENGPHAGKSLFTQFVLSSDNANALGFWFRHMNAMGLNETYFQSNPTLEKVAADLIGRRCRATASIRQWNGEDRNQVDSILPAASGPSTAPPPSGVAPGPTPSVTGSGSANPPAIPNVPAVPPAAAISSASTPMATPPPPPPADDDLPF